jgi:transcription antitermination factor NusG
MLQHWYAVYTKPRREKKVSTLLSKKGIIAYCPLNYVTPEQTAGNNKKGAYEPLFCSQIFVYATGASLHNIKNTPGVTGFAYWKAQPAIISNDEIEAIKEITCNYMNIKIEKALVQQQQVQVKEDPKFTYNENSVRIKYRTLKVMLPSLGYMLSAEKEWASREVIQPEFAHFSLIPKKLVSLFTS